MRPPPEVPEITPTELKARLDRGDAPTLVDVREPFEAGIADLPDHGQHRIPTGEFPLRFAELSPKDEIVVYCRSGSRSAWAVAVLMQQGYERVYNLQGGSARLAKRRRSLPPSLLILPMQVRALPVTALAALLLGLGACSPESGEAAPDEWPLSEIEVPASAASDSTEDVAGVSGGGLPGVESAGPDGAAGGVAGGGPDPVGAGLPSTADTPPAALADAPLVLSPAPPARTDFEGARFARPEHVRGLYVNAWAAGSTRRMEELLAIVRETEVNSLVIDIKDATGFVSHASEVPAIRDVGATGEIRIRDLPALLDRLEAEGVYPIARIVVIKDPLLALARPDLAIQDTAGGVWVDSKELIWLNPYQEEVWDYHVALAREVAEMGFPEIQWDYIRFPDAPDADYARATFPGAGDRPRYEAIRGFLSHVREELADLPVRSTADVFGVTTTFRRDIGLGQLWRRSSTSSTWRFRWSTPVTTGRGATATTSRTRTPTRS